MTRLLSRLAGSQARGALLPRTLAAAKSRWASTNEVQTNKPSALTQQQKQEEETNKAYVQLRDKLLQADNMNMAVLRDHLVEALDIESNLGLSDRLKLNASRAMGGEQAKVFDEQKAKTKSFLDIIGKFTNSEMRKPLILATKRDVRMRIVQELGMENDRTYRELMRMYETFAIQHEYLHREASKGRKLPKTTEEYHNYIRLFPTRLASRLIKRERAILQQRSKRMGKPKPLVYEYVDDDDLLTPIPHGQN